MLKCNKKIAALFVAAVMAINMAVPAFALEPAEQSTAAGSTKTVIYDGDTTITESVDPISGIHSGDAELGSSKARATQHHSKYVGDWGKGGTWEWGIDETHDVYSNLLTKAYQNRTSVKAGNDATVHTSGWQPIGVGASVSTLENPNGGNHSYYDYR